MDNYRIVVADSGSTSRKQICNLLTQKGYRIYEATDGAGALRIARKILPHIVLIDVNIWGINAYELARIIEDDGLSTVLFITGSPDKGFYEVLGNMNVFAYITKPVNAAHLHQILEFSLANLKRITVLEAKVKKLEKTLSARKKVDKAKGILMKKRKLSEDEAYQILRKKSMDECTTIEKIAEKIIASS
ncbi:response regulator receiver and ANTAR domain protein [Natronincola peptidivorans]|uniref:Stage 0 sporulation protein A homolog n=1 Tax=Natronincola peptidivorans TaxID=426128 RepID=A0A1I0BV27_9FIRM|nr:ANTAR domain-containing protein [Natronincola peptidivorans]SET10775.1 response regulator receiver and ANTAR domain protein [Natronincola peptidivorans]